MESLIAQSIVQNVATGGNSCAVIACYGDWVFWISILVGVVGGAILFFLKPTEAQ
ncbi:MAG: hypothetical protein HY914_13655 [Desulfomonile tiedjei]|nr:hypothetical protein [Desulfomonile tiedjei]